MAQLVHQVVQQCKRFTGSLCNCKGKNAVTEAQIQHANRWILTDRDFSKTTEVSSHGDHSMVVFCFATGHGAQCGQVGEPTDVVGQALGMKSDAIGTQAQGCSRIMRPSYHFNVG